MLRSTSWVVALAAFSILVLGGASASEAAGKKHARLSQQQSYAPSPKTAKKSAKPHAAQPAAKHRRAGEIRVTVVDQSGKPVAGAKVHLCDVVHHKKQHSAVAAKHRAHHGHHRSVRSAVTNASGQATFSHCAAGNYHATASKKGVGRGSAHASLKSGEQKSVRIRLHHHGKHKASGQTCKAGKCRHAFVAPHSKAAKIGPSK